MLPNRYVPEEYKIWDKIEVFVYLDNDERFVAVTDKPYIKRCDFAVLRCNEVSGECIGNSCRSFYNDSEHDGVVADNGLFFRHRNRFDFADPRAGQTA